MDGVDVVGESAEVVEAMLLGDVDSPLEVEVVWDGFRESLSLTRTFVDAPYRVTWSGQQRLSEPDPDAWVE